MNAARQLQHTGGHFVLLAEGKRPAWRGWPERRPPLHLIEEHASAGRLGIIPASLGGIVVDVDAGTPETVTAATGAPWAVLGTRRGSHLWYDAPTAPVRRTAWTMGTTSGDLIGTGYVKLHGDGAGGAGGVPSSTGSRLRSSWTCSSPQATRRTTGAEDVVLHLRQRR